MNGPVDTVAGYLLPLATATEWSAGLSRLRDGSLVTTTVPAIGPAEPGANPQRRARRLGADRDGESARLTGTVAHVPCAEIADALVVPVDLDGQAALAIVELDGPGVAVGESSGADLRRPRADVRLDGAAAASIHVHPGLVDQEHVCALGHSLFLDAEAVGGGTTVLARTVAYCTDRVQFGRPVGSFQAVRHRIADATAKVEGARSLAYRAAWDLGSADGADMDVLASRLWASAAYLAAGEAAVQCHGGMGFTWEQGVHVFYRAALSGRGGAEVGTSRAAIHAHLRDLADPVVAAGSVR